MKRIENERDKVQNRVREIRYVDGNWEFNVLGVVGIKKVVAGILSM